MIRPFYPAVGILTLLALSGCSTVEAPPPPAPPLVKIALPTPPPLLGRTAAVEPASPPDAARTAAATPAWSPRPHGAVDRALRAQGVYLARPHRIGELEHLMITEVWRHDPALGPAPEVGAEWMPGHAHGPMRGNPDHALICVSATPRGRTMTIAEFRGERLVPEGIPLAELRSAVESGRPDPMPEREIPPAPEPDQVVAEADEVYLARLEPGDDGRLTYHVSEVWRHTRPGPAPEVGAPVPGSRPLLVGGASASGDTAVVFLFPPRPPGDTGRHTTRFSATVHNGYVWGTVSLSDLYRRVVGAPPRAPQ